MLDICRLGREKKRSIENKVNALKRVKSLKRQYKDSYRLKEIKKNKQRKNVKFTESLDLYIIVFSLNFLTVKELSTERHLIVQAAKINQHICFKGFLTSKFGSQDILLWK